MADTQNVIVLPKATIVDSVDTSSYLLVEQSGLINRFNASMILDNQSNIAINASAISANAQAIQTLDQKIGDFQADATVVITLTSTNGKSMAGAIVNIYNDDTDELLFNFIYVSPQTLTMPMALHFRIECSDVQSYKTPDIVDYIASGENPQMITITYQYGMRYGFKREKTESSPSDRITYLFDAEGMTPAATDLSAGTFNAGSWGDFIEEIARPVMVKYDGTVDYELNHDDQTYKLDGITASDVANTSYAGNAMVEFKEYKWVKRYSDSNYEYVIFSNVQFDEDYHAYAHTNASGVVQDAFYWGMFKGTNVSSKLRSIGTGSPMVSQTRTTEISYAVANGDGYYTIYKSGWEYIADLLTLISKSDNSQTVFGRGRADTSSAQACGTLKNKGPFWGSSNGTSDVKVFWIEGFWGNVWEGMAGLINNKGNILAKMYPPYNTTGDGYVTTGIVPSGASGGYINTHYMTDETGWIPMTASGSETTYLCDGLWFNNSQVDYALVGGDWGGAGRCGSRYVNLYNLALYATAYIGSRISFIHP